MSATPTAPVPEPEVTQSWALLRLICGHICLHGSMAGLRMAAPLLALRQGHSAFSVGVLLALFSLTQVFLALPAGRYADHHGLKRPMGMGVIAASSGATLAVLWPQFWVLCIGALLMGGATGAASIALQRHVGRAARDATELKRVFSWLAIGPAVSNFVGPVAAGLLIDHVGVWLGGTAGDDNGFRGAFVLLALLPWATWLWVRHTTELPPVQPVVGATRQHVWHLLRAPMMRRLLLVNWLLASCWDVHTFVVPVLGHERAFSASVIGAILGGFAIAAAAVRVAMPLLASHLKEWMVVSSAMPGVVQAMESGMRMDVLSTTAPIICESPSPIRAETICVWLAPTAARP